MAKKAQEAKIETPVEAVLEATSAPTTYAVTLGIKTPSVNVQYRMIEAHVTVTSTDYEQAQDDAVNALAQAVVNICDAWSEPYPEDMKLGEAED